MSRSVSKRTIAFGLVSIPVKFFVSATSNHITFNKVTPKGNRVKQFYRDAVTNEEVSSASLLSAYEAAEGKFITFSNEELKSLEDDSSELLEIVEVVPISDISTLMVEKTYYLQPDKGGARGFKLLSDALSYRNKAAITKWTTRGKENLIAIVSYRGSLIAHQLYYSDELRDHDMSYLDGINVKDKEIELALKLLETLETPQFELEKYTDNFKKKLLAAIDEKRETGKFIVEKQDELPVTSVSDLVSMLQKSVQATP